jgi:hypothetical protein
MPPGSIPPRVERRTQLLAGLEERIARTFERRFEQAITKRD